MINFLFTLSIINILAVYAIGLVNIIDLEIGALLKTVLILLNNVILLLILLYIFLIKYNNRDARIDKLREIPLDLTELNPYAENEIIFKMNRQYMCTVCGIYKPERTHHCSTCNRCYLKMDHHCYFLDTCIHFFNYKFFLLLLVWLIMHSMFNLLMIILLCNYTVYNTTGAILCTINFTFCMILFIMHFMQAMHNETTIERKTIDQVMRNDYTHIDNFQTGLIRQINHHIVDRATLNPYNISRSYNLRAVFGQSFMQIFTKNVEGDGLEFEKNNRII